MLNRDFEYRGFVRNQKDFWDLFSVKETAENKGRAAGLEEGLARGRAEGRAEARAEGRAEGETAKAKEIARKMKAAGMSESEILALTGLTVDDIESY